MNIVGKLIEIFDTQQISDSFKKREFVVEYSENPQYPELIKFELIQDKCSLLDSYSKGNEIDVSFNLKGRKWSKDGKDMYFTTLQAWRLEAAKSGQDAPATTNTDVPPEPEWLSDTKDEGDLPF